MAKTSVFLFFFLMCMGQARAQSTGSLKGVVSSGGESVAGASVGIRQLNIGTATNGDGSFFMRNIPAGRHLLWVSALGYFPVEMEIEISPSDTLPLRIQLRQSIEEIGQLVVTGTYSAMAIKDNPVKISHISHEVLQRSGSQNLLDAAKYINGLIKQVDCAVCGTGNIRINGMEGPYTLVLIDGMPVIGALASVYSLSGLNPDIINSIEIIKGPSSTLYGSQAMGGVINIITKNPSNSPLLTLNSNINTHAERNVSLSYAPRLKNSALLLSGNLYQSPGFTDANNDGFSDLPMGNRLTLFSKWNLNSERIQPTSVAAKLYVEDRFGGVEAYRHKIRGSQTIYGESIYTRRLEVLARHYLPAGQHKIQIEGAYSYHHQNSYYGAYQYLASQQNVFSNLIFNTRQTRKVHFLGGLTMRYDLLEQNYDDVEIPGAARHRAFNPGIFSQFNFTPSQVWNLLAGLRMDYYKDHHLIFSPRLNVKYSPHSHTTFRMNSGTGFRIVNLFTEEHQALTGSRSIEIAEELKPEKSFNVSMSLNQIIDIGRSIMNMDIDVFYTRFSNKIIPDYSQPNKIVYSNSDSETISKGISLNAAHNFIAPLTYMLGFTIQDVYTYSNHAKNPLLFSPRFTAVFTLSYTLPGIAITADYTSRLTGSMKLPEYPGFSRYSPAYTEHNLKFARSFGKAEGYISIQNLFNYTQPSPIIAAHAPFSDEFATDYIFGPIQQRSFLIGIQFQL